MIKVKVTQTQVTQLAEAHIHWFTRLLGGQSGFQVNRGECEMYLKLWESIRMTPVERLATRQKFELTEAVQCGDYASIVPLPKEEEEWDGKLEFVRDPEEHDPEKHDPAEREV